MKYPTSHQGIILISVLLFLLMLSLLSISALNSSLVQLKMAQNLNHGDRLFYTAETALQQATQLLIIKQPMHCLLATNLASFYPQQSITWWLSNITCRINLANRITAHYVIEKLTTDPCSQINQTAQPGVDFYRVTAWTNGLSSNTPTILQSTVAVQSATHNAEACTKLRKLDLGRQSWRLLQ